MKNIEATGLPQHRGQNRWPYIIVGLLVAHLLLMVVAVSIAVHNPSFSVESNYYQKALNWDESRARLRASEKLGWHIGVEASPAVDPFGHRAVTFVLTDAAGNGVEGATLTVDYFHHAHAGQDFEVNATSERLDPRRFFQAVPMRYPGIWEFHFTAKAGGQTFVASTTEYVNNEKPPSDKSKT